MRRTPRANAAAALLLLLAAACTIDETADIAAYRTVLDHGQDSPAAPPEPGRSLDFRTAFRLANAIDEALAAEGEAFTRALIAKREAAAAFLPTLSFFPLFFARERIGSDTPRGVDLPLRARVDLDPVRDLAALDRSELAALSAKAALLSAQDDLFLDTGRVLLAVLLAARRAAVLETSLRVQEARVEDARARVEAGMKRPLDVALAESRAADAKARLVLARSEAENARHLLGFLVGYPVLSTPLDDTLPAAGDPPDADALSQAAFASRADVRAADFALEAARASVEEAYGAAWPRVSLDLAAFVSRASAPEDLDWTSAFQIEIPIFQAGLVETGIRSALSHCREAGLRAARVRRIVRRDVTTTAESLVAADRRLELLAIRREAARRAFDLATAEEQEGLGTNLERLIAQDDLLAVELDFADAEIGRMALRLALLRTTGRIHDVAGLDRTGSFDAETR